MFEELSYSNGKLYRKGKQVGTKRKDGYLVFRYHKKLYLVHRVVWYLHHGRWPENDIDHINKNQSDNRIQNLRDVTRSVNLHNKGKPKGCYPVGKKYYAKYALNGKQIYLGTFDTLNQAQQAYLAAKAAVK